MNAVDTNVLVYFVDESVVSTLRPTRLMKDGFDFSAHATVVALRMKLENRPGSTVVYTGNSAAVEVLDDPSRVGPELSSMLSSPVNFYFLATMGQTVWLLGMEVPIDQIASRT